MKVSVVGGGVMGLAAARAIAQRGYEVTLYEQFELKHTRGSSHGSSRIFRLSYTEEYWIRLAQRAYELWRELEQESGRDLLVLYGLLDVDPDPRDRLAAFESTGVEYERLTPADARERFGVAYDDVELLVFTRDAGISLAEEAIEAFAAGARAAGAEIREHTRVESLDDVPGDRVVVAAGGFAGDPIPSIIDELDGQFYALTAPGTGVKAGRHKAGREADPDDDDPGPDERIVDAVSRWVARRLPRIEATPLKAETCIYTNVEDERFVCERRGRYVVGSACSGHGFKFAPAVGELLASLV